MHLLLGCAVQCENKAKYIEVIMSLEVYTQQAIVEWIRKVSIPLYIDSVNLLFKVFDTTKHLGINFQCRKFVVPTK